VIRETSEIPTADDLERLADWRQAIGELLQAEIAADKSWYRIGPADIPVVSADMAAKASPLSQYSSVVRGVEAVHQIRLYVRDEDRAEAHRRLANF
jgi:hypothetical protein